MGSIAQVPSAEEVCGICLCEDIVSKPAVQLNCGCQGWYCRSCIVRWMQDSPHCPTCRKVEIKVKGNHARLLFNEAMRDMETATNSKFENKVALNDSFSKSIYAIVCDRDFIEAYSLAAYVCLLIDDYDMARKYVEEALRRKPNDADCKQFMEHIEKKEKEKAQRTSQSTSTNSDSNHETPNVQ